MILQADMWKISIHLSIIEMSIIKVPSIFLRSDLEKFQEETLQKINDVTKQQDQKINDVTRQQDHKMSALQVSTERNLSSVAEAYRSTGKVIKDVSLQVFL